MRKKKIENAFLNEFEFSHHVDRPGRLANTDAPYRVRIMVRRKGEKAWITKKELNGKKSDKPAEAILYAKDIDDAIRHLRPVYKKILQLLRERELAEPTPPAGITRLSDLLATYEEEYFTKEQSFKRDRTIAAYRSAYKRLKLMVDDYDVETLYQEEYLLLQEKIRTKTLEESPREYQEALARGDADTYTTSTGKKMLRLLFEVLQYLKDQQGFQIPAEPVPYIGTVSNAALLQTYVNTVRILPQEITKMFWTECRLDSIICLMVLVIIVTGLRVSEAEGLLWGDIRCVPGSQGLQYYLRCSGQYSHYRHRRSRLGKTTSAYRVVPLPKNLGEILFGYRDALEKKCCQLEGRLVLGEIVDGEYIEDATVIGRQHRRMEEYVRKIHKKAGTIDKIAKSFSFVYDLERQTAKAESTMHFHAFRRDYITRLYCSSGVESAELYHQAGHATTQASEYLRVAPAGKTEDELYRMCLTRMVGGCVLQPQLPLRYRATKQWTKTEVPTTQLQLQLDPGQEVMVHITDTEPGTTVEWSDEEDVRVVGCSDTVPVEVAEGSNRPLLAATRYTCILSACYPFQ